MRDKRRLPSKVFASEDKEQFLYILALLLVLVIGSGVAVVGWYLYVARSDSYSADYIQEEQSISSDQQSASSCDSEKESLEKEETLSGPLDSITEEEATLPEGVGQEATLKNKEDLQGQSDEKEDVIAEIAEEQSELVQIFKTQQEAETKPFERMQDKGTSLVQTDQAVDSSESAASSSMTSPRQETEAQKSVTAEKITPQAAEKKHKIALILEFTDQKGAKIEELKSFNIPLTLAIAPFDGRAKSIISKAKAAGLEVLLDIPMEALNDKASPGREALYIKMSPQEIEKKMKKNLTAIKGYSGVKSHMGSKFTADLRSMESFLKVLKKERLLFVDSLTTPKSRGREVASKIGVPFASRSLFIDYKGAEKDIESQLKRLEKMAKHEPKTVVIAPAIPELIPSLKKWVSENPGFDFVFVRDTVETIDLKPQDKQPILVKNAPGKPSQKAA